MASKRQWQSAGRSKRETYSRQQHSHEPGQALNLREITATVMERFCFSPVHFCIGRGVVWFFSSPICKSHCTPLHLHTHTKHPISRDREKHADDTRSNQNVAAVLPSGLCFTKKVESQSISRMRHCSAPVTASFCSSL